MLAKNVKKVRKSMVSKNNDYLRKYVIVALSILFGSLVMIIIIFVLPNVAELDLMPNKPFELIIVWAFLCFIYFICIYMLCSTKWRTWIKVALILPNMITLPIITLVGATFINTLVFTESVCAGVYDAIPYAIVVRKDDSAQSTEDLHNYRFEMLKGMDEFGIHSALQAKTDWKYTTLYTKGGLDQMATDLMSGQTQAIVIRQERLEYLNDSVNGFRDNTKVVYEFAVEDKIYKASNVTSLPDSFVVYINGFDSADDMESMTGESKLNILMVVNRKQRKLLFINIPRNYYVQLANIGGTKDKLSSSSLYGIKESVKTVEQLYDIDVDFYISLDMSDIGNIVRQLGGIEIADTNVDDGGYQVVEAVIKKMIGTDTLRRNYGNILQAMEGSFRTDISNNDLMKALVYQIIAKHDWQFESITAKGKDEPLSAASVSVDYSLYNLEPDEQSIMDINAKIKNIMSGR